MMLHLRQTQRVTADLTVEADDHPCARLGAVDDRHAELGILDHPEYGGVYEVDPQPHGELRLKPSVGPSGDELLAEAGARPLTSEEFEAEFGDLPTDDEG